MNEKQQITLSLLYNDYRNSIKPLIAEIEANYEQFPQPIFNEIRAFNDHISRCYIDGISECEIDRQLDKAHSHISRMLLDCYKYLNVYYNSRVELFEKQTKHIDITTIGNGEFYINFRNKKRSTIKAVKEAKKQEYSNDGTTNYVLFQESYNKYVDLVDYIDEHISEIKWAKAKFFVHKGWTLLIWLISIFLGALLTNNNQEIIHKLCDLFNA